MAAVNKSAIQLHKLSISHTWEVGNVNLLKLEETVSSETFSLNSDQIKWQLEFSHLINRDRISGLLLRLEHSDSLTLYCECEWSVRNKSNKLIAESKNSILKFTELCHEAILGLLSSADLTGDIIVNIQMELFEENLFQNKKKKLNSLSNDIGQLMMIDEMKNVTLLVEDKELKVHKFVIRARSLVLAAMLDEDKDCDELHIPDVDYDVMERVVHYMYTDQVEDIKERARQLYPSACRFGLLGLKTLCEDSMVMTLTANNVWTTLELLHDNCRDSVDRLLRCIVNCIDRSWYNKEYDSLKVRNVRLVLDLQCAHWGRKLEDVARGISYITMVYNKQWAKIQPQISEIVLNTLTVKNAFRTLVLEGQPEDFRTQVIKFIKNHLNEFTKNTDDFEELALNHPQLYLDTMSAITDETLPNTVRVVYAKACTNKWLDLKTLCENILVKSLTVENAAQTFILTDGQPGDFKDRIVDFIKSNGAQVTASSGFKSLVFLHPHLFQEVSGAINDVVAASSGHVAG